VSFSFRLRGSKRPKQELGIEFAPALLYVQHEPPSPLPRTVLRGVLLLLAVLLVWACWGKLDVVAVAEGKLVPLTYLKIVQPAEAGIVREIAVVEGQHVVAGQVLVRMDSNISEADSLALQNQLQLKAMELRRIESELAGRPFKREPGDSPELYQRILSEYQSNVNALQDRLATENASLIKARHDLASTLEVQRKLKETLPTYQAQEVAYEKLGKDGFMGKLMVLDKQRERIEKEQDLRSQEFNAQSLNASIDQSERRLNQIISENKQKLQAEQVSIFGEYQRLQQEWAKQSHKNSLLELKAPQSGVVKDLATHTPGTVVSPGAVLMTLVPNDEELQAEVWLKNEDAGFVIRGQKVKIKLAAYPFQKYGMVDGEVLQVSADATERGNGTSGVETNTPSGVHSTYRTLVQLKQQYLEVEQDQLRFSPGMEVSAEVKLTEQTVIEYLLSPVRRAFHDAGRER
jgi:hemolysin D